jgi:hypothetical protein
MTAAMLLPWFGAFLSTLIIESPILALFSRGVVSIPRTFAMSLALQLTTHPLLWLVFYDLVDLVGAYAPALLIAEGVVFGVEAAFLGWMWAGRWRLAAVATLVANLASTAVGLLR